MSDVLELVLLAVAAGAAAAWLGRRVWSLATREEEIDLPAAVPFVLVGLAGGELKAFDVDAVTAYRVAVILATREERLREARLQQLYIDQEETYELLG